MISSAPVPVASCRRNSLRWVLEGLTHRGPHLARPRPLTAHQRDEALQRLRQGETQADVARTYNVDPATISRLVARRGRRPVKR
jgi:hypothetical protein